MGNPNVGKSAVFNRLTGASVITANYPGTTVEFTKGRVKIAKEDAEIIDVPGTYTLEPTCRAEEIAVKMIDEGDIVVNIVDATNLERSLNLTLQLVKRGKPMLVALNFWDETKHTGVQIDVQKLEEILGVPCLPTVAVTGVGIKALIEKIPGAKVSSYDFEDAERWHEIGKIVESVQRVSHRHHTFLERLGDASIKPFPGILITLGVVVGAFEVVRQIGEALIGYVFEPLFENVWAPIMLKLSAALGGEGFIHDILIGRLIGGNIDFRESFGLLTTGLYVEFAAVLPYVIAFYLVLSILEDCGYLPRLAVLADTLMHRLGLHGMAIVPMILGLGCNVPGSFAIRIMESRKGKFIAATLMAICVPCMALIAMIFGLAGEYGAAALVPIFAALFVTWIVLGMIMNRFVKGEIPEILLDVPPYRIPYLKGLLKKVWMRIFWFLKEAMPWVLFGVFLANIFYSLGVISFIGRIVSPVIAGLFGLPPEAAGGLMVGFLRKDVAVGMLAPLHLTMRQIIVACVVLAMYFPCVATFAVLLKELGFVDLLKATAIMIISALVVGGLLNLILSLF